MYLFFLSGDTCMVCVEGITAFIDGPLAGLAAIAFLYNHPSRFVLQFIVSMCQLYGTIMYFTTEYVDDFQHSKMFHPLHFWFYFITLNSIWILVPSLCVIQSSSIFINLQSLSDKQELIKKDAKPVNHMKRKRKDFWSFSYIWLLYSIFSKS